MDKYRKYMVETMALINLLSLDVNMQQRKAKDGLIEVDAKLFHALILRVDRERATLNLETEKRLKDAMSRAINTFQAGMQSSLGGMSSENIVLTQNVKEDPEENSMSQNTG